jgi:hypothetical protein
MVTAKNEQKTARLNFQEGQLKTFVVSAHDGIGVQRVQHCPPYVDISRKQDRKWAVGGRHLWALHRGFEHSESLAERQILQRQLAA